MRCRYALKPPHSPVWNLNPQLLPVAVLPFPHPRRRLPSPQPQPPLAQDAPMSPTRVAHCPRLSAIRRRRRCSSLPHLASAQKLSSRRHLPWLLPPTRTPDLSSSPLALSSRLIRSAVTVAASLPRTKTEMTTGWFGKER
ncbi:hypothetical protein M0R45_001279 [Rubus argutus]|uniref:Uncharacterized protein n=1 Tax=Rubus argutus TaxID=59490 RepID=A0AAW1VLU9_RUBAR